MAHIDKPFAMATTSFIFSTALAVCMVLLIIYDRPFGAPVLLCHQACFELSYRTDPCPHEWIMDKATTGSTKTDDISEGRTRQAEPKIHPDLISIF